MSTLREAVQQRRAAELPPTRSCEPAKEAVRAMWIHSWSGEQWVLPWAHFISACHQGSGNDEQLVLTFAQHEVILQGARLALLVPAIASFHLDCLRDMPDNFRAQADKNEPFISRVSVRALTDLTENDAETS
ncbi:MAG TPA: hypothetical protein VK717_01650 [Opitutaceae bacterium]|jgi:hypothetical protein|nr:hypothetical protein [Opitutaceae bacterium]